MVLGECFSLLLQFVVVCIYDGPSYYDRVLGCSRIWSHNVVYTERSQGE